MKMQTKIGWHKTTVHCWPAATKRHR